MGVKISKIMFIAEDNELKNSFKRVFKVLFGFEVETFSYKYAFEDFVRIVKSNYISHIIIYLHLDGRTPIEEGMKKLCQLRRGFLGSVKTPFIGLGFWDEGEIKSRFPIFKKNGQLYIQLPKDLGEIKKSVLQTKEHDITKEEINKLCPESIGHNRK